MRYKLMLLVLIISIILSGCINKSEPKGTITEKLVKINYVDKNTIINGEDFPDFKLMNNVYYIAPENLSLTLETETGHGVYEMSANAVILPGYRVYGGSETYNSSKNSIKRYILLQYKVFDNNENLNEIINKTAEEIYIKNGYKYTSIDSNYSERDSNYSERIVVLESNFTNLTNNNITHTGNNITYADKNITIILFGFDTVIGRIGVQDSKGKSLNEALKILDIVFDRLKVRTKDVKAAKISSIISSNKSMKN